ncbi:hypothetical protein PR202_ga06222 [Eleusine coracana subsp. coracana]|uniref:Uncharacterized protein n=1 Tax=Eleusine coracana subsp. coracana TaxID=191504 RepID=A0AAV5BWN7_ELECO|nr:hypothetical protein PR202_ga06222 [Eleusine coracana subsp. coracana]
MSHGSSSASAYLAGARGFAPQPALWASLCWHARRRYPRPQRIAVATRVPGGEGCGARRGCDDGGGGGSDAPPPDLNRAWGRRRDEAVSDPIVAENRKEAEAILLARARRGRTSFEILRKVGGTDMGRKRRGKETRPAEEGGGAVKIKINKASRRIGEEERKGGPSVEFRPPSFSCFPASRRRGKKPSSKTPLTPTAAHARRPIAPNPSLAVSAAAIRSAPSAVFASPKIFFSMNHATHTETQNGEYFRKIIGSRSSWKRPKGKRKPKHELVHGKEDNHFYYKNLVAFLSSEEEDNGDCVDDNNALAILKEKFACQIAYERKRDSSIFLEYWVPTYLSKVQLQLYSSILLANSSVLQSQVAIDGVGALGDIIECLWKCCDHPFLVEECPHNSLVNIDNEAESTDSTMRASSKLTASRENA